MKHEPNIDSLLRNMEIADAFRSWLLAYGDILVDAADFLGGPLWARRASAVVACARDAGDLHAYRRDITRLARHLRLEIADGLSRPEGARHAVLRFEDPRVDRAMFCANAITRGARALEALWLAGLTGCSEEGQS
ncbi:MAG: hypothetical protein CVT70_16175 [Alphaproteobacteria bacterium HGW-Alphaproteobacteria-1]|jgi:hypothetical protein|nr:MAG: hypothetical protein CVT70_16175 [Alphaproteobacteria bacterium HGW-Alphaproteobacteria-1]